MKFRNAKRAVDGGYALLLRFIDVTADSLREKLHMMLDDSKYRQRAKEVSVLFRDNPMNPMEESMYWIEYVARHKGASVFQSNAVHMPWYIYFHLDIMLALFVLFYVIYKIANVAVRLSTNVKRTIKYKTC